MKNRFTGWPAIFSICTIVLITISCNSDKANETITEKKMAVAGNEVFTESDFYNNIIHAPLREDSAIFAKKTIEKWAMESLLYQEAINKLEPYEIDVEKQVNEYRKQLTNYLYENKLIENNLDTTVINSEIEKYYNNHVENFILKDNIIIVNYVKIPVQSKEILKIKKLMLSPAEKDRKQLEALCLQHAESFFTNDSTWLLLEEIKKEIPQLKEQLDFGIYKGRIIEFSDNEAYYYLKIKDVKTKNTASPLAFERENIKTYIINNRKVKLIQNYKRQLLENARKNQSFKIF